MNLITVMFEYFRSKKEPEPSTPERLPIKEEEGKTWPTFEADPEMDELVEKIFNTLAMMKVFGWYDKDPEQYKHWETERDNLLAENATSLSRYLQPYAELPENYENHELKRPEGETGKNLHWARYMVARMIRQWEEESGSSK